MWYESQLRRAVNLVYVNDGSSSTTLILRIWILADKGHSSEQDSSNNQQLCLPMKLMFKPKKKQLFDLV